MIVEDTHDVAQQDQQIRSDERADHRRKLVVVTKPKLVDRHGVVLVDDRNDAELEQLVDRLPRVQVAIAIRHRIVGQQDLRDVDAERLEGVFVRPHEQGLPGGGGSLKQRDLLRTLAQPEPLPAQRDGTRGDEHDLAPCPHLSRNLLGDLREPPPVGAERAAADFDDHSLAVAKRGSGCVLSSCPAP